MTGYLTLTEAAERLGISDDALRRRIERGDLAVYRNPRDARSRLISAEELAAYAKPLRLDPLADRRPRIVAAAVA